MKRIFSIISGVALLLSAGLFTGCAPEEIPINEEIALGRCLTPTKLETKVVNGEFVEFTWTKSNGATAFVLELFTDAQMTGTPVETFTVKPEEVPYTADLEADMVYYARVKAIDESETGLEDSNWAKFEESIQTYAIKSSLNPVVVARTESSITVGWDKDPEVDHIRISPALSKEDGKFTRFDVAAAAVEAAQVEVTGLNPSVNYTLTVHFKSADRGNVKAWTRPSLEGATEVSTSEALVQALTDGAAVIKVAYSETPYFIGSVKVTKPVAIYGDTTTEGAQPTVQGGIKIGDGVTSIHFEAITFDGLSSADYPHHLTFDAAPTVESITVVNCNLNNYLRGVLYENSKGPKVNIISYNSTIVYNVGGDGGDCFDFRGTAAVGKVEFKNSTLNGGARTWFRIDANTTLESISITHCTFNNLCFANNGNNNGIFNIRALNAAGTAPAFVLTHNVFLNMNDANKRCCLIAKNSTSAFPTELANNFFYNCYDRFFIPQKDGSSLNEADMEAAAAAGRELILVNGSVELENDPCVDSVRDKYNVISKEVIEANAGDPRWYAAYVEIPEDLTQEVTSTGKVWNLTDAQVFKKLADKDMVRDGIRFYVQNTPINFTDKGFEFSGEATVGDDGIPVDGAIGIKVNQPGSIVISTAEATGHSSLTVSLNGEVSAAVAAGTELQKITFASIAEESMIYIYGCHPATMTFLQWTDDVEVINTVLDTPVLTIDKTSVQERAEETVTVSWEAVDYAGAYEVTFNEKTATVTETSFAIETATLSVEEEGADFKVSVKAVPADDDYIRTASSAAEVSFHVNDVPVVDTGEIVDPTAITETYYKDLTTANGFAAQKFDDKSGSVTIDKLTFGDKAELDGKRYKHGGGSSVSDDIPTNRFVSFKITRAGTISHKVISGSSGDATRKYVVALVTTVGGTKSVRELYNDVAPTSSEAEAKTTEVTADMLAGITEAAVVYIYTLANCNTYAVGYDPVPAAPAKVDKVWDFSAPEWVEAMNNSGVAANTNNNNFDLVVDGLRVVSGGSTMKWNNSGDTYYWQPGGKSDGTTRYFEFTAEVAGKLTVFASNTGSGDDLDKRFVTVKVGDAAEESLPSGSPSNMDPTQTEFSIAPGVVKIYPTGNALRFYKIEFHSK